MSSLAEQISRALLGDDDKFRLPAFDAEDEGTTRDALTSKISQLNAAIDDVSSQLKSTQKAVSDAQASA